MAKTGTDSKIKGLLTASSAMIFVVLMGLTSLFSDMTYEAGRSLSGQFLQLLGASAFAVGTAAGAGELLGYGLRLFTGYVADRTGRYWLLTIGGYAVNLLALPFLAFVGRWEIAIALLFIERIGKAIRVPARDAMLSHATTEMGRGWGFGLHEAMDQIGAVLGPLLVALILYLKESKDGTIAAYQSGFAILFIPASIALIVLIAARFLFPRPEDLESKTPTVATRGYSRSYWWYLAATCLVAIGFADFPLMAYHFRAIDLTPDHWMPTFYALAMAFDAIAALVFGRLFDRLGLKVMAAAFGAAALFAPLVFLGSLPLALAGLVLWGIGMGVQESIMRAAVAGMVPTDKRATAYGLFHTGFGIAWFAGSALMGYLYDQSVMALVIFSVAAQLIAIPLVITASRKQQTV
ncbi:MAG: MFS transporter [Anaerolineae bacterium]|nr:MFS transporter [Anaerolineae bacterium]